MKVTIQFLTRQAFLSALELRQRVVDWTLGLSRILTVHSIDSLDTFWNNGYKSYQISTLIAHQNCNLLHHQLPTSKAGFYAQVFPDSNTYLLQVLNEHFPFPHQILCGRSREGPKGYMATLHLSIVSDVQPEAQGHRVHSIDDSRDVI